MLLTARSNAYTINQACRPVLAGLGDDTCWRLPKVMARLDRATRSGTNGTERTLIRSEYFKTNHSYRTGPGSSVRPGYDGGGEAIVWTVGITSTVILRDLHEHPFSRSSEPSAAEWDAKSSTPR